VRISISGPESAPHGPAIGPRLVRTTPHGRRGDPTNRTGQIAYFSLSAAGVVGFLGLLVASHYIPEWATPLRVMALAWFVVIGVVRFAAFWRR